MITDFALLSDLNDLDGGRILNWLKSRKEAAVIGMASAPADRLANIQAGRYNELADIIKEIETAREQHDAIRAGREATVDMNKAY